MPCRAFPFYALNFGEIIYEVGELSLRNPRTEINTRGYVNRAINIIGQRKNWTFMHTIQQVTIQSGQSNATMPASFKCLSEQESPISFTYGEYRLPVTVTTRSQVEACGLWPLMNGPLSMPLPGGYLPIRVVFMERDGPGGLWTLNMPPQFVLTTNMVFNVQGYYFPPPLQQAGDTNAFTQQPEVCEAIVALAKAIGYRAEEPGDPKGEAAMAQFEDYFSQAAYMDVRQQYQIPLRM